MGEVYRARDTGLGRDVAVKVMRPWMTRDTARLRLFEKEARAAGAISDPNILAVFDVGAANGMPYVVSELLEGETLGARLRRAPPSGWKGGARTAAPTSSGWARSCTACSRDGPPSAGRTRSGSSARP